MRDSILAFLSTKPGNTKDGSKVKRHPNGGTLAHQLWLFEEVARP